MNAERDQQPPSGMSLRVYTLDGKGTITSDTGIMRVDALGLDLPAAAEACKFPPCGCPRCRKGQAP
ncbi:hypothetical protein [Streptomyces flavofungini]|uniref:hypothetical protein n=1 Tax=Streptomyces flavofungini TaxID=68200 RepID=UPI0034DEEC86